MAFENAQVGLALTAFYPHITLGGTGGYESRDIATLISAPSAMWSLGGDLLQPILNGGRNRANLAASRAAYDESIANYREAVLVAFQQVEDGLSGLALLNQAAKTQQAAVADSRRALDVANSRYVGGVTTYLDVITAQSTLLNNERLATQLLGEQMVTSVFLVKALGGGWDASEIKNEQVRPELIQAGQQSSCLEGGNRHTAALRQPRSFSSRPLGRRPAVPRPPAATLAVIWLTFPMVDT